MISINIGTHTITCTATGNNGKSERSALTVVVNLRKIVYGTTKLDPGDEGGIYTDSNGNQYFTGTNPNNYISINDKLWRIIGITNGKLRIKETNVIISGPRFDTDKFPYDDSFRNSRAYNALKSHVNDLGAYADAIDPSGTWNTTGIRNSTGVTAKSIIDGYFYTIGTEIGLATPADMLATGVTETCPDTTSISNSCFSSSWMWPTATSLLLLSDYTISYPGSSRSNRSTTFGTRSTTSNPGCLTAQSYLSTGMYYPVVVLKSSVVLGTIGKTGTLDNPYTITSY